MPGEDRIKASMWWRGLTLNEQESLVTKYKPTWTFAMVTMSSSTIEVIWKKEVKGDN